MKGDCRCDSVESRATNENDAMRVESNKYKGITKALVQHLSMIKILPNRLGRKQSRFGGILSPSNEAKLTGMRCGVSNERLQFSQLRKVLSCLSVFSGK